MGEPSVEKADSEIEKMAKFAIDDNAAEAQHGRKAKLPFVHQAEPKTPPTHNTPTLRKELKKLKPTEFREDARIWQLYLEEAEEKAKDKADLWNTGLDSLLIFAGLFAGVVSSFVIDARGDLQEDSQQNLLTGILDMLRDGSIGDIFGIPGTAYWISGLWVISLFTTIFSAIMGVLAKAWLAKYVPATTRREAKDAYHRYKLDRQAERWHLKEVLILVPLLVQIASVLFLIGLVIQIHGDSPTIGRTLLSFCLVGALVYFFMTLFPLIVPSSPFNTPLSEMCDALFGQNLDGEDRSAFKTDIDEGLGEILYTKLIQSPKPFHIDEAIAEVALPAFEPKWTEFLCKNDTPKILLSRFRQCASSRTSDTLQRDETLCNHLLAFLSFAELYEAKLHEAFEKKQTLQGYQTLDKSLHEALEPGNPLHRWNELPEGLRPLLFALRTHVLVLLHLPQNDGFKPHAPSDFNANEMADRPWEMTFQDIRSSHRIHFTLAACRGLIQGENHLKSISSFILSLCLAKAAFAASETGRTSEWASSLTREERDDVNTLALRYISKLYHATVTGWEDMAADALREILSVEVPLGDTESTRGHAGVLRCLIFSLSQPSHALRVHAIKMLKLVSSPNPVLFNGIINASVKNIATMTVNDDQGVRDDGLELLIELVKANEPMAESIRSAVVDSVQSGLSKYEDQPRISTIQFVEKLSMLQYPDNLFTSCISDVIPSLVDLFMDNSAPDHVRQAALKLSQRLWSVNSFPEVKSAILNHLGAMLERDEFSNRYDFFNNVQTLVKAKDFASGKERLSYTFPWYSPADFIIDIMSNVFGKVVKVAIYEEDRTISVGAQDFLKSLAKNDRFNGYLPNLEIMTWLEAVTVRPSRWRVRHNAVLVVETFSKQLAVTAGLLNILVEAALTDDDNDVRTAAIKLVSDLWKKPYAIDYDIAQEVKKTIISDSHKDTIQNEVYTDIREKWVLFLGEVAEYVAFSEAIPVIIQVAVARGSSSEFRSKAVALLVSESLTKGTDYREVVKATVPDDLEVQLPCTSDLFSKGKWIKLLIELLPHVELQDVAQVALAKVVSSVKESLDPKSDPKPPPSADQAEGENSGETPEVSSDDSDFLTESDIAPPLRRLLGKSSWDGRMYWVEILASLAEHFPEDFSDAPKIVLQIAMHDPDGDVRNMALQSLRPLAKRDTIRDSFLNVVVDRMDSMADDGDWNVRFALAQLLAAFGESKECKLPEQATSRLTTMALDDRDYDVRSESVNSLAVLLANDGQYPEVSTAVLEKFEAGVKDGHWKPRQSWMKLIPPHIKDAGSARVNLVFDIAINDGDIDVRNAAVAVLEQLLSDAKLRDAMASKIGKSLASAIKNDEQHSNTMSLLTRLTTPKPPEGRGTDNDSENTLTTGHEIWIGVTMLLGRNDFQGVPKIVEMAIKDMPDDNYVDLKSLFGKVKLQDPVQNVLPKYLESALKSDSNDIRSQAVTLFDRLLCSEDSLAWDYGGLLGRTNDAQLISRLAEITVKDDDYSYNLRKRSLTLLKTLFNNIRFQDSIKSSLSKVIESCFKEPDLMKFRSNAIAALHSLTEANSNEDCDKFKDIVSPSIPHLLKITLLVIDRDNEYMRKEAEDILLENLTSYPNETKINREVLSAIPPMIPTITVEGKRIALQLGETLQLTDDTAASIAHALAPLLRTTSSFPRAAAIELLSKLYSKHRTSKPRLIESAIPEIITLALDEKDDVGGIRTTAIQLLVSLSAAPTVTTDEHSSTSSPMNSPVVKQITPLATKFMGLLQNENLRPSVVELLSLMSNDAAVRRTISLQIIASAFGTDNVTLQGHCELLARLISDGRFGDGPTDKVMLFLASAIVTRPKLAPYRFEILTALWCRYGSKSITPVHSEPLDKSVLKQPNDLVDWFTFALFGRHATVHEVRTWLRRCKVWLPDEPELEHDHHADPEHPVIKEVSRNPSKPSSIAPPESGIEHHDAEPAQPPTGEASRRSSVELPEPQEAPSNPEESLPQSEAAPEGQIEHQEGTLVKEGSADSVRSSVVEPQPEGGEHSSEPLAASSKRSSMLEQAQPENVEQPLVDGGAPSSKPPSVVDSARG